MAQHLEDRYIELVTDGTPEDDARRFALEELRARGVRVSELRRVEHARPQKSIVLGQNRGRRFLEILGREIRYGLRRFRRNPGFAAVVVFVLALGIGGTTAIFSVVECVLLKPLPYAHPEELVSVHLKAPGWGFDDLPLSPADYFTFRKHNRTFQDIGLYSQGINSSGYSVDVTGLGPPEQVSALRVTDGLLPILGVKPLFGRLFTRADDSPGSADTVILTFPYWRRKFGDDRSVIGKAIDVDSKLRTIIGVLPRRFRFLDKTNLAMVLPFKFDPGKTYLGTFAVYGGIARLKTGVTPAQADADVARMIPIVVRSFPLPPGVSFKSFDFEGGRIGPNLQPLKQAVVGNVGKVLWILMGSIGLVLVIACANVANLLLVRVEARRQELAVRAALGASRRRIAGELFVESLTLAVLGGLIGLGLAYVSLRVLVAMAPPGLPRLNEIGINGTAVLFALGISLATGLFFGCFPALRYSVLGIEGNLRDAGRSASEGRDRNRYRSVLVIVQVALAFVLLVGSGLMIRTFRALTRVNPGFVAPSQVQTFRVQIRGVKDPDGVLRVQQRILRKLRAIPGVLSAGFSRNVPMDGSAWADPVFVKGHHYSSVGPPPCRFEFVSPGYLKTLGTPLIAGRDLDWSDIYNNFPAAMVSENFAREYWHEPQSALGKQIRASVKGNWSQIVGVVADVHQDGVDKEAPISAYWPMLVPNFEGSQDFEVRTSVAFALRTPLAGSESLLKEVRRAVWSVDPNFPLAQAYTLDYYYDKSMARTSFTLVMLALAGGMALLLGVVGLYGILAYTVSQRTREIGIRMALGAQNRDVMRLVLTGGMSLMALGLSVGIAAAVALTRFLSNLLYGIQPTDPLTFGVVLLILTGVALVASYIPARRAAKVDPMVALRYQ